MAQQITPPTIKPARDRTDDRDDGREYVRIQPREPHEKYAVPESAMRRGMDYFWAATAIRGMPNPRFPEYYRAGWRPARAADFPELSGLDLTVDQALVDLGVVRDVKPDGQVLLDGLMLMTRPEQMSREARRQESSRARQQVDDHLHTQRERSNRAVGPQRTRIQRSYGPPDEAPTDAEVEMG